MNVFSGGRNKIAVMAWDKTADPGLCDDSMVFDLARRQAFIGLTQDDFASIRSIKDVIDLELPRALEGFYGQVRKTAETRKFFSSTRSRPSRSTGKASPLRRSTSPMRGRSMRSGKSTPRLALSRAGISEAVALSWAT